MNPMQSPNTGVGKKLYKNSDDEMIELQAELYKVVRANQKLTKAGIKRKIKEHFSDVPAEYILKALYELSKY